MSRLILASRSPARRALLLAAGVEFETDSADVDEASLKSELLSQGATPKSIASQLAAAKALDVARRRDGLVIGADQTLDFDGQLFDKPSDREEAKRQLLTLRGRRHHLYSAVAAAKNDELVWADVATSTLTMRIFSDAFLDTYLDRNGQRVLGCVGAYELEREGVQLFERIDGDYFAILGLPMLELLAFLREHGCAPC